MYGNKLKNIRKHFKLTQEEMALRLSVAVRSYAAYEREENNPPYSMLVLLYKDFNINLNWFIANVGEMFNAPKFEDVQDEITAKVESILKSKGLI